MAKNNFTLFLDNLKRLFSLESDGSWKIIALCFLGATIFWFFNALNKEYVARIRYPIEFVFDKEENIVVEELPEDIRIEARGGGWDLLKKTFWFNIDPVKVTLENPASVKNLTPQALKPLIVDQITDITINEVLIDSLKIDIEKKTSRTVAVNVDSAGIRMADNFRIVSPVRLSSDTIRLTGPESRIDALGNAINLSLKNELISEDFEEEIDMTSYFPPKVKAEPSVIEVSFDVERFVEVSKEIIVEPVNFPQDADIALRDSAVVARILISRQDLEKLDDGNIRVIANFKTLDKGDSTVQAQVVEYPDFIADIALNSDKLKVRYDE